MDESRFVRRNRITAGNARNVLDRASKSMNRSGMSYTEVKDNNYKRASSLYSSVQVGKGGFTKMSNATSIMTPYTNIGGEVSRYGGKNRTLKQWYEGKAHTGNVRH